jgi:creatinine amidohydrolase
MNWEEPTAPQFEKGLIECEGVCLVPLGVLEKHGDHFPLGIDLFIARAMAFRAAELKPAIVFPL